MKPEDRLRSWKEERPKTPKEAATADLLETVRSTPTLSGEALARVRRRVREKADGPRSRWIPRLVLSRTPVLAGALASLLVVGGLTFIALDRPPLGRMPIAPQAAEVRAPAANAIVAPPEATATGATGAPPPAMAKRGVALAERDEPNRLSRPTTRGLPLPAVSSKESARSTQLEDSAGGSMAQAAPALAGAPPAAARVAAADSAAPPKATDDAALLLRAEQLANMGRCADAIVPLSMVVDSGDDPALIERALFDRGRCRLTLNQDVAARQDLEAYLTRFPNGRFATRARQLLR